MSYIPVGVLPSTLRSGMAGGEQGCIAMVMDFTADYPLRVSTCLQNRAVSESRGCLGSGHQGATMRIWGGGVKRDRKHKKKDVEDEDDDDDDDDEESDADPFFRRSDARAMRILKDQYGPIDDLDVLGDEKDSPSSDSNDFNQNSDHEEVKDGSGRDQKKVREWSHSDDSDSSTEQHAEAATNTWKNVPGAAGTKQTSAVPAHVHEKAGENGENTARNSLQQKGKNAATTSPGAKNRTPKNNMAKKGVHMKSEQAAKRMQQRREAERKLNQYNAKYGVKEVKPVNMQILMRSTTDKSILIRDARDRKEAVDKELRELKQAIADDRKKRPTR
jgi:hypothetical protein